MTSSDSHLSWLSRKNVITFPLVYASSSPNACQFLFHESSYHHTLLHESSYHHTLVHESSYHPKLRLMDILIQPAKNFSPFECDVMKTEFSVREFKGSFLLGDKAESTGTCKYPQMFRSCLLLLCRAKRSECLKC
jgi:hypothetical protein